MAQRGLSKELEHFIRDQVENHGIRNGRRLTEIATQAGFMSPATQKPYHPSSGYNWLKAYRDPKKLGKAKPKAPKAAPTVIDFVSPLTEPAQAPAAQVVVILCPVNQLQNIVSELCKPT